MFQNGYAIRQRVMVEDASVIALAWCAGELPGRLGEVDMLWIHLVGMVVDVRSGGFDAGWRIAAPELATAYMALWNAKRRELPMAVPRLACPDLPPFPASDKPSEVGAGVWFRQVQQGVGCFSPPGRNTEISTMFRVTSKWPPNRPHLASRRPIRLESQQCSLQCCY